jgi:hypothetical protein
MPAPKFSPRVIIVAALCLIVVIGLGLWQVYFEMSRPIVIAPAPLPAGKKMSDMREYFVQYKLVGSLPIKPNEQLHLFVYGKGPTPYMRIIYGDDLKKGSVIGLAVRKGGSYTAMVQAADFKGRGRRYSNKLRFSY